MCSLIILKLECCKYFLFYIRGSKVSFYNISPICGKVGGASKGKWGGEWRRVVEMGMLFKNLVFSNEKIRIGLFFFNGYKQRGTQNVS